jgi:hypothetical protein
MEGHPSSGVMKRHWSKEAPKELWRYIGTSWRNGDYPWVLLGVVMAQSGIK